MNHQKVFMWQMWVILVILNVFDYITTRAYIKIVGTSGEANPCMRWCFEHLALGSPLVVKLMILGFLGMCIQVVSKDAYSWIGKTFAVLNVLTATMVGFGVFCIYHNL